MRQKDIPVIFPDGDVIVLDQYLGKGLQPNETELPEDAPGELCTFPISEVTDGRQRFTAEPALPEFNQAALAQLEAMGFPQIRCQKALLATGNSDPEAAMEWLFAHMEDPGRSLTHSPSVFLFLILTTLAVCVLDIDAPIIQTTRGGGAEPSPEQIGILADMGFSPAQARKALRETVCGLNPVRVLSF